GCGSEVGAALGMLLAVEAQDDALAVHSGVEIDGAAPERLEVLQGQARLVQLEVDSVVTVHEQKLGTIFEIAVHHIDDRLAEIGELVEELFLDDLEVAAEDLPGLVLVVVSVDEELVLQTELGGEKFIDEGDVVVEAAHLEDLLAPQAELQIPALLFDQ